MKTDFPFTIRDVLKALNVQLRRDDGNFLYIDCPNCFEDNPNKKGKCQIRLDYNVFNCQRCGTGGGMLKLYSLITGCNESEANHRMREYVKGPLYDLSVEREGYRIAVESKKKLTKLAPKYVIDKTYRELLSACVLRKEHRENLLNRGLSDMQIAHYGFKSVPWKNQSVDIVQQLLSKGCELKGVPGFYQEKGIWKLAVSYKTRGFFVPMVNIRGQCLGMQIRLDSPTKSTKYIWFTSSGYQGGSKRTAIPTFSNYWNIGKSVCITEGGLKAYVAHSHSGVTFIGIPGVTQYKMLPLLFTQLKKKGVTWVCDCLDMDYKTNPFVCKARERLKEEIIKAGFGYARYEWNEQFKGIDDYFTAVPPEQRKMIVLQ